MKLIHKQAKREDGSDDLTFVLSDETKDRYGDIIEADGWDLANFRRNPVALFGHDQGTPIGFWEDLRVEGARLLGRLQLAAKGTSQRIDEIISLIEQGILRAVSVGFLPKEQEPLDGGGVRYKRQELLETSVVSVPANPAALAVAKQMNLSPETVRDVWGEDARRDFEAMVRKTTGVPADPSRNPAPEGTITMNAPTGGFQPGTTLQARIEHARNREAALQTELRGHIEKLGDSPTKEQVEMTDTLNATIERTQAVLRSLLDAEQRLAVATSVVAANPADDGKPKVWAQPAKKVEPLDFLMRAFSCQVKAHVEQVSPVEVLANAYGEGDITTRALLDITTKAAVAPADTATSAWAGVLTQTAIADFFELLLPQSVYPGLSNAGLRLDMDNNNSMTLPTRDATPTVAGSFVGEGAPIPVRRAGFSSISIGPKKMAVITTFTREMAERSVPQIEQLLRDAIQEDTAISIDTVLLDANPATSVRPAGIRNGITTAAGTAGGTLAAALTDLKGMLSSLMTATNNNVRKPVFLLNPLQRLGLTFLQDASGGFVFRDEINNGRLVGAQVIESGTVPSGVAILVDAADFVTVTGDTPRFNVSDQATLHMEDTTPLAIGTAGSPNTVAAPVRSLYQTDSLALRMILPMNWAFRRTGMAVERTAVTW